MLTYLIGGLQGFSLPGLKTWTGSSDAMTSLLLGLACILLVWPHLYRRTMFKRKFEKISSTCYPDKRLDMSGNFI